MAAPATNTKVERVIESIEALAIASAARAIEPGVASFQNVLDARTEAADALRDFLQPVMRVVQ